MQSPAARAHRATHRAEAGISTSRTRAEQRQRSAADVSMRQGLVPSPWTPTASARCARAPHQRGPQTPAARARRRAAPPRAAPALTTFGSPERVVVA